MKKKVGAIAISLALVASMVSGFALNGGAFGSNSNNAAGSVVAFAATADVFSDVATDAWYADAVSYCQQNGLMSGTSATTFAPESELSRAMLVTILHRAAGTPSVTGSSAFSDVENGAWYSNAVAWVAQNSIVNGYGNGLFGTNDPITREQLITILWNYGGSNTSTSTPTFTDMNLASTWATSAISWGNEKGIVNTKDGNRFDPKSNAIRAEAAYMLKQLLTASGENTVVADKPANENPVVYMTTDITSEGLMAVYNALGANPTGNIAIKVTTGEPPNSNYLREELIGDLARSLDGTIVECNTAYSGSRASDAMHIQVAKDHGFYDMTEKGFDLMDAGGQSISLPVVGGEVLTENFVGANFADYDYFVVLSHFKGHGMAGYGGAIKNISIGIGSSEGKTWIHTGGTSKSGSIFGDQTNFLKSMAEAGKSVVNSLDGNILYVNVMNKLSVDCDCNGNPKEPDMHDIGILASFDPVALDRACIDLVEASPDGKSLMERINGRNGTLTLDHAAKIGLGSLEYELVSIDN